MERETKVGDEVDPSFLNFVSPQNKLFIYLLKHAAEGLPWLAVSDETRYTFVVNNYNEILIKINFS